MDQKVVDVVDAAAFSGYFVVPRDCPLPDDFFDLGSTSVCLDFIRLRTFWWCWGVDLDGFELAPTLHFVCCPVVALVCENGFPFVVGLL